MRGPANFAFRTTKNILYELGGSAKTGTLFKGLGCGKQSTLLLVTDHGVLNANIASKCIDGLKSEGFNVEVFSDVIADPPEKIVKEVTDMAKGKNVAGVIGLGGGSSMDVAKLVAFLSNSECKQSMSDIYGVDACKGERLPLIQIPTTAGTGSEVTPISIVTTGASEKKGVVSPVLLPDWAIVDGELTLSLPAHVTAATGVDAMVHAIEAFTSRLKKNPLSDALAKEALKLLIRNIRLVCTEDGAKNADARGEMLLGSMFAGMAFANAPVAAVHALAYPIGSHFHVPHGVSNSMMLPHVLRFNATFCTDEYAELGKLMFKDTIVNCDFSDIAAQFYCEIEQLTKDLNIPQRLRDVGIQSSDLEMLATEAMKQTRLLPNNPREVTYADALQLYKNAF